VHRPSRGRMDTGVSLRTALKTTATGRRGTKVLGSMVQQNISAIQTGLFRPPIKAAVMTGPRGLAVRGISRLLGQGRGQQVQAIVRQTATRPSVRLGGVGVGVVGVERLIEATTGRSPARMAFDLARQGAVDRIAQARGRSVFDTGQVQRRAPMPATSSDQHVLVNQWQTFPGGPVFSRFADGHIEVTKKNGTIRHYRPYRPVVIPKKWDARAMRRVATALKRQRKTATKILQLTGGVPTKKVKVSSREHRSVDV